MRMVAHWVDGRGGGRRKESKGKESREETERKRRKPHTNPPNHTTSPTCNCAECITTYIAIWTSSPTEILRRWYCATVHNDGQCSCLDGAPVQATGCHRCCKLRMVAHWADGSRGGRRKQNKEKESKEEAERKRRKPRTNPPNHTTSPMCNCAESSTTFNVIRTSSPTAILRR